MKKWKRNRGDWIKRSLHTKKQHTLQWNGKNMKKRSLKSYCMLTELSAFSTGSEREFVLTLNSFQRSSRIVFI